MFTWKSEVGTGAGSSNGKPSAGGVKRASSIVQSKVDSDGPKIEGSYLLCTPYTISMQVRNLPLGCLWVIGMNETESNRLLCWHLHNICSYFVLKY